MTGAAGFVGSHLVEALAADGAGVRAIDAFTDYYDPAVKRANAARTGVPIVDADIAEVDLHRLLDGVDVVFHLAGQPGVRLSWATGFPRYLDRNVLATQRLLEAVKDHDGVRLVYASSSSVYGEAPSYPTSEDDMPAPHSPYGVTKLAAEHLCGLYAANHGVHTVALRYFSVYGPRQRPDMGLHRFCEAALDDKPLPLYGTGEQVRDVTYVGDVVAATLAAATAPLPSGTVMNIAGGGAVSVNVLLDLIADLVGRDLRIERLPEQPGDVAATGGTTDRARDLLGWRPRTDLPEGLAAQLAWHREQRTW